MRIKKFSVACEPPFWARSGHAQTIAGHLWPSPRLRATPGLQKGENVELALPDGDRLVGRFYAALAGLGLAESAPRRRRPDARPMVVYFFHGLGGTVDADYMHRGVRLALDQGHAVLVMNHRGCGEGAGLARLPYHSGRSEDLAAAIAWGRARFPTHRHVGVGFSLSGNALLLLLSGDRGYPLPDAAIAINAPIHLAHAAALLKHGLNRVYDRRFVRLCLESARASGHPIRMPRGATLTDFDQLYTAPRGGFGTRERYYAECSTYLRISNIRIPTVLLTAADDPFVGVQDYQAVQPSDSVLLHIEAHGGHMGYLSGKPLAVASTGARTRRWLDAALDYYLAEIDRTEQPV